MKPWAALSILLLAAVAGARAATFSAPESASANVFEAGRPVQFQFHGPEQTVAWTVQDFRGQKVNSGPWTARDGADLSLGPLPPGYYELTATADGQPMKPTPFGVVQTPERPVVPSAYALDSAQNTILKNTRPLNPFQPKNDYAILDRLIGLSGVSMSRERMNWPGLLKPEGGYNWAAPDQVLNALAAQKVPALNLFTRAPAATLGDLQSVPRDLLALYQFSKDAAARYRGKVVAWEFWNEPDEMYCLDSAWDFAAAQKAAYLGLKAGNPEVKVLIGSNATSPTPRFIDLALQNDAGRYFDIYNFHTYASAGALPKIIAEKQALLRQHGLAQLPLWLTEIGLQNEGSGSVSAGIPNQPLREHSPEQEMQQARFVVYSLLTAQARGVERTFFFALPPYNEKEGTKVWGLLRWNWTVKPGFIALANLTAQLGRATLLGVYDLKPGTIAYLFQRGPEQVLVAWADRETEVEIPAAEKASVVDLMGHSQALASATATLNRDPQYFTGLHGLEPMPTRPQPAAAKEDAPPRDAATVLAVRFLEGVQISGRVVAKLGGEGDRGAELIVTNFSATSKNVVLNNRSQGIVCAGLPATCKVPPGQALRLPFTLRWSPEKLPLCYLRLTGQSELGEISQLYVPIQSAINPLTSARAVALPAALPGSWISSAAGVMASKLAPEPDTMQFITHFPPNSPRWIYPKFDLRSRQIDLTGSLGISFEVRLLQPQDPKKIGKAYLMINTLNNGQTGNFLFPFRPTGDWQKASFQWDLHAPNGFAASHAVALKIGVNALVDDVAYEVRQLTVYYGDQATPPAP